MQWKPNTTVAAIAEQDGRFLLVEETINGNPGLQSTGRTPGKRRNADRSRQT